MKQITSLAVSLVLTACLLACASQSSQQTSSSSDDSRITTEKAQQALNQWITAAGSGQVSIVGGVRELPSENAATADLTFSNFTYVHSQTSQTRHYSGAGKAVFMHYTDGRWVLNKVTIGDVWANTTWTPNSEVR
jgi:hypothetical protein